MFFLLEMYLSKFSIQTKFNKKKKLLPFHNDDVIYNNSYTVGGDETHRINVHTRRPYNTCLENRVTDPSHTSFRGDENYHVFLS